MNDEMKHGVEIVVVVAHHAAWCFAFWFPFRQRKLAWLVAIPVGFLAGAVIGVLITLPAGGYEFAGAFPFALAAIIFVVFRKRRKTESEQSTPPYSETAVRSPHG
jgi:uncharacterized membrane protein YfcA